jgi:hypothetical protein
VRHANSKVTLDFYAQALSNPFKPSSEVPMQGKLLKKMVARDGIGHKDRVDNN